MKKLIILAIVGFVFLNACTFAPKIQIEKTYTYYGVEFEDDIDADD
jgi:hypothetical protein